MYDIIIFDFDGTLVDSDRVIDQLMEHFVDRYQMQPMDRQSFDELKSLPLREKIRKTGLPLYKLPRLVKEVKQSYANHIDLLELVPGIENLIKDLAGQSKRLFILSSNASDNIVRFLKHHEIDQFEAVYSAPDLMRKDKGIRQLLKKHQLNAKKVIYIGDELRDIAACQKIPIDIAAVTWGHDTKNLLQTGNPNYLISRPDELYHILNSAQNHQDTAFSLNMSSKASH